MDLSIAISMLECLDSTAPLLYRSRNLSQTDASNFLGLNFPHLVASSQARTTGNARWSDLLLFLVDYPMYLEGTPGLALWTGCGHCLGADLPD